ncbi:hypothetical protein THAOC_35286, partial [Thalassiosira oceanica]
EIKKLHRQLQNSEQERELLRAENERLRSRINGTQENASRVAKGREDEPKVSRKSPAKKVSKRRARAEEEAERQMREVEEMEAIEHERMLRGRYGSDMLMGRNDLDLNRSSVMFPEIIREVDRLGWGELAACLTMLDGYPIAAEADGTVCPPSLQERPVSATPQSTLEGVELKKLHEMVESQAGKILELQSRLENGDSTKTGSGGESTAAVSSEGGAINEDNKRPHVKQYFHVSSKGYIADRPEHHTNLGFTLLRTSDAAFENRERHLTSLQRTTDRRVN